MAILDLQHTTEAGPGVSPLDLPFPVMGGELTPATITANTNDYDPDGEGGDEDLVWRLSSDASRNLTGVVATESPGIVHVVINVGANPIVLKHESSSSSAANRLTCPGAVDYTIAAGASTWLEYDGTTTRWRVLGDAVAGLGITGFATPSIALGTAAAAGAAATVIRSDATIVAFDATAPTSSAEGDAAAAGSANVAARRDHKHGREAFGTTAVAIGTSAGGTATTPSKSDHVHATGAGTPSSQTIGDAASTGSGPAAAMTDHKHAMPSAATPSGGYGTAAAGSAASLLRSDAVLAKPTAADVDFSADVTTNNVTTGHHGLAPKADGNAAHYLDGSGAYSTPAGGGSGVTRTAYRDVSIPSGASTTIGDDSNLARIGAALVFNMDGNDNGFFIQYYRDGSFNQVVGFGLSGGNWEVRGTNFTAGAISFSIFVASNSAGAALKLKNNAGFGRTLRIWEFATTGNLT